MSDLSPSLSRLISFLLYFLFPVLFRQEVVKQLWWVAGVHLETTHHINVALAVWLTLLTARIHWTDTFILSTEAPRNLPGRLLFSCTDACICSVCTFHCSASWRPTCSVPLPPNPAHVTWLTQEWLGQHDNQFLCETTGLGVH